MGRIDHLLLRWGHRSLLLATGVWVLVFAGMFAGLWRVRWSLRQDCILRASVFPEENNSE